MAVQLDRVTRFLDDLLKPSFSSDSEGNGLSVAGRQSVRRLGAALSTSFAAIDSAATAEVDFLLVHHAPWSVIDLHLREAKLSRLSKLGISLYSAHDTLDAAELGFAAEITALLGLDVMADSPDGLIVGSPRSPDLESWIALVSRALGTAVRAWPNSPTFSRVAVVPGGGGATSYVAKAVELGCDTFMTGEGSLYTELFAREVGVSLVYASHVSTEFPQICGLASVCAARFDLPWTALPEGGGISGGGKAPLQYGW